MHLYKNVHKNIAMKLLIQKKEWKGEVMYYEQNALLIKKDRT